MKKIGFRARIITLSILILGYYCFLPGGARASDDRSNTKLLTIPETLCFSSVPRLENFPEVSIDFRLLDSSRKFVSVISSADLQVQENDSAPIPVDLTVAPEGIGLNLFFVVDLGNRTDLSLVSRTLQSIASYFQDGIDQITIIANENNGASYLLKTTSSLNEFKEAILNMPASSGEYWTINNAIDQALNDIEGQNYGCTRPSVTIIMSAGDTLIYSGIDYQTYIDAATASWTKITVFHFLNRASQLIYEQPRFENLASKTGGLYRQIVDESDITDSLRLLNLAYERNQYTATYRSNIGETGDRTVSLLYQGRNITDRAQAYSVIISDPTVKITSPVDGSVIQRHSGFDSKDVSLVDVEFSVSWPDGHDREIASADLIILSPTGSNTVMSNADGSPSEFTWDMVAYAQQEVTSLGIKVEITDEFGIKATSQIVTISINYVTSFNNWLLYSLAAVVVVLLVLLIVFGRRIKTFATSGKVGHIIEEVRKTIVGGRKKGKPFASLHVIDGPPGMINQELKIYSESVKLGRDPNKSDLSFFTPDAASSVSGLHCKIERVGGIWRIVPLSASGNETFVDNQALPMHTPYPLKSGQTIRMGYLAQQPVVFQFNLETGSEYSPSEMDDQEDNRKTKVVVEDDTEVTIAQDLPQMPEVDSSKDADDLFEEYRQR